MGSSGMLSGIGILGISGTKVGISGFGGDVIFGISGNGGSSIFGISGFGGNATFGISDKGGSSTFGTGGKDGCSTSGSGSVGSGKVGVSEWTGEDSWDSRRWRDSPPVTRSMVMKSAMKLVSEAMIRWYFVLSFFFFFFLLCGLIGGEKDGRNKLGFIEVCSGGWFELKDYIYFVGVKKAYIDGTHVLLLLVFFF
jgi:hypothetical protein